MWAHQNMMLYHKHYDTNVLCHSIIIQISTKQNLHKNFVIPRLEPIMLTIVPYQTYQNFTHYSYFIPIASPIIPFYSIVPMMISQCRSDNIYLHM